MSAGLLALCVVLFGVAPILYRKDKAPPDTVEFCYIAGVVTFLIFSFYIYVRQGYLNFSFDIFPECFLVVGVYLLFNFTILRGSLSLTLSLISCHPIFAYILAVLVSQEPLTLFHSIGVISAVVGIIIIQIRKEKVDISLSKGKFNKWWAVLALITGIALGVSDVFIKYLIKSYGLLKVLFQISVLQIIVVLILMLINKNLNLVSIFFQKKFAVSGCFLGSLGGICFYIALGIYNVSLVTTVVSLSLPLSVFLSAQIFKEKLGKDLILAIALVFLGTLFVIL